MLVRCNPFMCHSERSEESRINFSRFSQTDKQRCFASLNMTDPFCNLDCSRVSQSILLSLPQT
jgi:hypothetical protein